MAILKANGKILKANGKFLVKQENPIPTELVIGGKTYPVVVIGNRAWLQYNLDYTWSGLTVDAYTSSSTNPVAAYPGNDNRTWGWTGYKAGLLYNRPAINYIRDNVLPLYPGWRVPVRNDFAALFSNAPKDLLSTTFPWSGNPAMTNSTGFTAVGGSRRTGSYEPPNESQYSVSYMAVVQNKSNAFAAIFTSSSGITLTNHEYFYGGDVQISLRLVRDVE